MFLDRYSDWYFFDRRSDDAHCKQKICVSGLFSFRAELNSTNHYYTEHLFACQEFFWKIFIANHLISSYTWPFVSLIKAITKERLNGKAFLEDPQIPIGNNLAERMVKPFVIGRKSWLYSTSPKGSDASAAAYSIINTAQARYWCQGILDHFLPHRRKKVPLKSE